LQSLKVSEVKDDYPDLAQALDGPEKQKWVEAIDAELENLEKMGGFRVYFRWRTKDSGVH
jgi:hypothetical protein